MSIATLKFCVGMTLWCGLLFGALSVASLPGDWGHGVCGPWGCGPPTQALLAWHIAWLIVLAPLAVWLARCSSRLQWRAGLVLTTVSLAALLSVVIYQRVHWWPLTSDWQRDFFWQRCAFCIATTVEIPIVQTMACGLFALLMPPKRSLQPAVRSRANIHVEEGLAMSEPLK